MAQYCYGKVSAKVLDRACLLFIGVLGFGSCSYTVGSLSFR